MPEKISKNKKNLKKDKKYKKKISSKDEEASDINFSEDEKTNTPEEVDEIQDEVENDKLSDDDGGVEDEDGDAEDEVANDSDGADGADGDDDCVYKFTKSARDRDIVNADDEMDDDDDEDTDVEIVTENNRYVKAEDRITKPYLTNYERVRLLSDRAAQIASGSDPMIKNVSDMDAKTIAKLELETEKTPLYIEREMPGGKIEKWYVWELLNNNRELITNKNNIKINTSHIEKLPIDTQVD